MAHSPRLDSAGRPAVVTLSPATAVTVTTTSDVADGDTSGFDALIGQPGADRAISLRESILASNATTSTLALRIQFAIPSADPGYDGATETWRIALGSRALPPLARGNVTIDGSSQPGSGAHPRIVLDGYDVNEPTGPSNGITITSSGNSVRGLTITNLYDSGIAISGPGAFGNLIVGCYIGPSASGGVSAQPNWIGVKLSDGAHDNTIGGGNSSARNLISGNGHSGILIDGPATSGNVVAGSWIGVGGNGRGPLGNPVAGILISGGAHDNAIGGVGQGNLISGNGVGIYLDGAVATTIADNTIGLGTDRRTPVANVNGGIFVVGGASGNLIGGTNSAARNIISGNGSIASSSGQGVYISGAGSDGNRVYGNFIGVDFSGVRPAGNYRQGVLIGAGARNNQIGGTAAGAGNVIAYNGMGGVRVDAPANQVAGNLIGLGADRATPLGNQFNGVRVGGDGNTIGPGNTIAFNQQSGVMLTGSGNTVKDNTINSNGRSGICVAGAGATISDNAIAGNGDGDGVWNDCEIHGGVVITGTTDSLLADNSILSNDGAGVTIYGGYGNSLRANSISGNTTAGIVLEQGGNQDLPPPHITSVVQQTIGGSACPLCRVEIFTDTGDEGRHFAGATTATADGSFRFDLDPAGLSDPNVTATHTDGSGNTSPFAPPARILGENPPPPTPIPADLSSLYMPQILR